MLDRTKSLMTFAAVLQEGSFRAAAKRLGLSPSTVSYHVSELEAYLGAPLLRRTTRALTPTELGQTVSGHAATMVSAAEAALSAAQASGGRLAGAFSITLTSALIGSGFAEAVGAFMRSHPDIELSLDVSDAAADLVTGRFDLGLRAGSFPDSALRSRKIGQIARRIVTAPNTAPGRAQDPQSARWIRLASMPSERRLIAPDGRSVVTATTDSVVVGTIEAMVELCVAGMGLATPPAHRVEDLLGEGRLSEGLPGWSVEPIDLFAVWPVHRTESPIRRAFLDSLMRAPVTAPERRPGA